MSNKNTAYRKAAVAVFGLALIAALLIGTLQASAATPLAITITANQIGITQEMVGAVEGDGGFDIADLTGLGINNYRMYGGCSRYEPVDDGGAYGSPTIAEIKADPNVINWSAWDTQFNRMDTYHRAPNCVVYANVSLNQQLAALRDDGVTPVITLRNVDNQDKPDWAQQLNPPTTTDDWNEWWEFVFAWVYYANVTKGLEVHDWEVHNEPDNAGQGWGGTLADYVTFTQYTADAIQYVYDTYLPGESFKLYAPVSTHCNEWIEQSLIDNDALVDVVDWHRYGPVYDEAVTIHGWIDTYDSDGVHEELYLSEYGTYQGGYENVGEAVKYGKYVYEHSADTAGYVDASAIFAFYSWSASATGVVLDDGTLTSTYYMLRMMSRGLDGGKTRYVINSDIPSNTWVYPVAAVDEATDTMYVEVVSRSRQAQTIVLDVSAHATSGTVTYRRVADGVNDEVVGTASLNNGVVTFDVPSISITQVSFQVGGGPTPTDTPVPPTDTPEGPTDTPEPTDTPGPTDTPAPPTDTPAPGSAMHVGDITMGCGSLGVNHYATATVTILDAGDQPVGTATVYGTFSGATSDSVSGDTAGDGTVTLQSGNKKNGGSWTFTVDDVVKSGWTYDSAANVETSDSITCP